MKRYIINIQRSFCNINSSSLVLNWDYENLIENKCKLRSTRSMRIMRLLQEIMELMIGSNSFYINCLQKHRNMTDKVVKTFIILYLLHQLSSKIFNTVKRKRCLYNVCWRVWLIEASRMVNLIYYSRKLNYSCLIEYHRVYRIK